MVLSPLLIVALGAAPATPAPALSAATFRAFSRELSALNRAGRYETVVERVRARLGDWDLSTPSDEASKRLESAELSAEDVLAVYSEQAYALWKSRQWKACLQLVNYLETLFPPAGWGREVDEQSRALKALRFNGQKCLEGWYDSVGAKGPALPRPCPRRPASDHCTALAGSCLCPAKKAVSMKVGAETLTDQATVLELCGQPVALDGFLSGNPENFCGVVGKMEQYQRDGGAPLAVVSGDAAPCFGGTARSLFWTAVEFPVDGGLPSLVDELEVQMH